MQAPATVMNRRILVTGTGGPEVLKLVEEPRASPSAGEVRLRVEYTALAFADLMARKGVYPATPKLPFAPGYDIVGIVDAVGAGVTLTPGTRMVGICPHFGAAAEFVCMDASLLLEVPEGVTSREAVCLPLNYLTAHAMLHEVGAAKADQSMFVQSAAGGVGSALVQLGKLAGLRVYGLASSTKQALVKSLGATPINRETDDVRARLLALEPEGVSLAFDSAGADSVDDSLKLVRPGGLVVSFGFMGDLKRSKLSMLFAFMRLLFWLPLVSRARRFRFFGHLLDRVVKNREWYRATMTSLLESVRAGRIKPLIGGEYPLEQLGEAQAFLESGKATGKVVVRVAK